MTVSYPDPGVLIAVFTPGEPDVMAPDLGWFGRWIHGIFAVLTDGPASTGAVGVEFAIGFGCFHSTSPPLSISFS